MTGQAESSGMRDSWAINEEHVELLSDLFRNLFDQVVFSQPEKTRNILGRHTIEDCRGLNNFHVRRVPDGSSDKGSVTLRGRVDSTQVSRLEVRVVDAFNAS